MIDCIIANRTKFSFGFKTLLNLKGKGNFVKLEIIRLVKLSNRGCPRGTDRRIVSNKPGEAMSRSGPRGSGSRTVEEDGLRRRGRMLRWVCNTIS